MQVQSPAAGPGVNAAMSSLNPRAYTVGAICPSGRSREAFMKSNFVKLAAVFAALVSLTLPAGAQFVEDFHGAKLAVDPDAAHTGWQALTGSGEATVSFTQKNHHGFMTVDARKDRRNVYWAIIKRSISAGIDADELARPDRELRLEAKIRISDAPRRVHFQINHTRTANVHINLREFDIADTNWHTISFTTKDFDATPKDEIFFVFGMTDMGRAVYTTEIAYIKVSVVDPAKVGPDLGMPLKYRPKMPPLDFYANAIPVFQDAIVDAAYPAVNFRAWTALEPDEGAIGTQVLATSGTQMIVLRWDLSKFKGKTPDGWGVLELTTNSVQWAPTNLEEFGYLRTVEIKAGDPNWMHDSVTRDSLFHGKSELDILNGQLIFDVQPALQRGEKTLISINPAVMARLISGETKGLAIYPQGAVNASFASSQSPTPSARPSLHFNVK